MQFITPFDHATRILFIFTTHLINLIRLFFYVLFKYFKHFHLEIFKIINSSNNNYLLTHIHVSFVLLTSNCLYLNYPNQPINLYINPNN